ncbi:MAG TPA: M28 family peptidase, partial [Firmicutes bacterium]|nr:M28 family peptidase [Bacillota bacterium]
MIGEPNNSKRGIVTDYAIAAGARLGSAVLNSRTTRSDHAPFQYVGVPAASFLRLPMEKVYHTPDDTVEKNISAARLEDSAKIVGAGAYYLIRPQGPARTHSAVTKENLRIFREELDRIIEENKEEYADIYVFMSHSIHMVEEAANVSVDEPYRCGACRDLRPRGSPWLLALTKPG